MTRAKTKVKPSKRDAILNAMLDVVAERGFHDAPMSLIAERSGAEYGVIYHYFAGKEEIIRALYERTRILELARLLDGFSPEMDPRDSFLQSWSNFYRFYREHGREMRFLEQYKSAGFSCGDRGDAARRQDRGIPAALLRPVPGRRATGLAFKSPGTDDRRTCGAAGERTGGN